MSVFLFLYINRCIYMNMCICTHTHILIHRSKIILLCYCIEEMACVRALWLGDGLGALAAAWGLLGSGDTAAIQLSLLFLLLPGMLLVPLLEHRAERELNGLHPFWPTLHLPRPARQRCDPPASAC